VRIAWGKDDETRQCAHAGCRYNQGDAAAGSADDRRAQKATRRAFLWTLIAAPMAWATAAMLVRVRTSHVPRAAAIPADVPTGLSVAGNVIVSRGIDGTVQAFAARCTHLGCRLDRIDEGEIVCPCHGSRFGTDGHVLAGPALRPLRRLKVSADAQTGGWIADAG
jgi:nitrite reductase/ring-hydroxylating ferredoxin subunit